MSERLSDELVANLAVWAADAKPTTREVEALAREVQDYRTAERILATRIPDLCPDCDQGDVKHLPYSQTCTHPNAPTVADLLRWGEWVATTERTFNDNWNLWGWVVNGEWVDDADLLAALRTEADR